MGDAAPTIADAEQALGRPVSAGERARIIKTAVLTTRPVKETEVPEGDLRARCANQAAGLGWDGPRLRLALRQERQASERSDPVGASARTRRGAQPGQLVLPNLDAAITQLTTALTASVFL